MKPKCTTSASIMRIVLILQKTYKGLTVILILNLSQLSAQTIYVSPIGDDGNSGSAGSPVKSFQKGADLAKQSGATTVEFAGGEYIFSSTVVLDPTYNGITFKAKGGETPVFSSLVQVTGWTTHSGGIVKAPLPAGITSVRYLQDKSENWMERSATNFFSTTEAAGGDDGGCIECNNYTQSTQSDMSNIRYPASFTGPDWSKVNQYDLRANTLPWGLDVVPLQSVNQGQRRLFTSVPALYDLRVDGSGEITPKAWVLNSIAGIDTPGEWAVIDGEVYLYPLSGTNDIYVPALTELIRVDAGGDGNTWTGTPVTNIVFDGLTFTGGDFRMLASTDVTAQHDWMVVDQPDGLLRLRNSSNITVKNCTFTKSGGTGLRVDRYGQNHLIDNNNLSYLGRGGINVAGRGPGYGDVSTGNTIQYNHLEFIGMEAWASCAILLDNSSNNLVRNNYIANTYFTGIAVVGPRQLMFAAWIEGADDYYVGREFHFYDINLAVLGPFFSAQSDVLTGSRDAMQYVYNYENRIEQNIMVDVCTGQDIFINGDFYLSGTQNEIGPGVKTNYINYNYVYNSGNHSINDYAFYSDSDQEDTEYTGNMVVGVQNAGNDPEPLPIMIAEIMWAEGNLPADGTLRITAHVTENSTFCSGSGCGHIITQNPASVVEQGTVVNGNGGRSQDLAIYIQMYNAVCEDNFPQVTSVPNSEIKARLASLITTYGGTVPACGGGVGPGPGGCTTLNFENFENGPGIWNDGGSDARRNADDAPYSNGTYSFRLRDNTSTSVITSDVLDFSPYDEVDVSFSYFVRSFDNSNEDFWLQVSSDNGPFTTVREWNLNDDFQNNLRYDVTETVTGPFTSNTRLRFRCDASGNSDWVYIDDIDINGCSSSSSQFILTINTTTGGTVAGAGNYPGGTSITLIPTPEPGYEFSGWTGDYTGTDDPYAFIINSNITLTANFTLIPGSWTKIDDTETNNGVSYSGSFDTYNNFNGAYQGTLQGSENGSVIFTFTGTGIRFYGGSHPYPGSSASVSIDGQIQPETLNFNGGSTSGDLLLFERTGLASGSHTITITRTGGEMLIDAFEYFGSSSGSNARIAQPLSAEPESISDFVIYPNPSNGTSINIVAPGLTDSPTVELYDLSGNLVKKEVLRNKTLDINELANGLYTLIVTGKDQILISRLVIDK